MLSVRITKPVNEKRVIAALRAREARRISNRRRANGAIETGRISIRLQRRDWWKARPIDLDRFEAADLLP